MPKRSSSQSALTLSASGREKSATLWSGGILLNAEQMEDDFGDLLNHTITSLLEFTKCCDQSSTTGLRGVTESESLKNNPNTHAHFFLPVSFLSPSPSFTLTAEAEMGLEG